MLGRVSTDVSPDPVLSDGGEILGYQRIYVDEIVGRKLESCSRSDLVMLVETVQRNHGIHGIRIEHKENRLLRLFPCAIASVQYRKWTSFGAQVVAIQNLFQIAGGALVEFRKLGGHGSSGKQDHEFCWIFFRSENGPPLGLR